MLMLVDVQLKQQELVLLPKIKNMKVEQDDIQ